MKQYQLILKAPRTSIEELVDTLENTIDELGLPMSFYEDVSEDNKGYSSHEEEETWAGEIKGSDLDADGNFIPWCLSVYCSEDDLHVLQGEISNIIKTARPDLEMQCIEIEDRDWVSESLKNLAPVHAGRFIIHGSHDRDIIKPQDIAIEINAGQAFGTGHHGTTAGCLDMLEATLKRRKFYNVLDLGTGSGVLAIALAKLAKVPILATDIDPIATKVTLDNAKLNGVQSFIDAVTSDGFKAVEISKRAPYDLIIANILARPLSKMAAPLARHLSANGVIILSGLLPHQKKAVVAAYRLQGLKLHHAYERDGWLTLVMNL
jgi:ribosomal protein L11 methyltransferase